MIRKFFLLITTLLFAVTIGAQTDATRWTSLASYNHCNYVRPVGDVVYAVANGSLFTYSPSDTEVRTYSRVSGLSDAGIERALYCPAEGCFVLLYESNNIDIFYTDETKVNLPQFKNSNLQNKTVNSLSLSGSTLLMATGSGLLLLNLHDLEFGNLYTLHGNGVTAAARLGDYLYAATSAGLYRGRVADNLFDTNNWQRVEAADGLSFREMGTVGNVIYAGTSGGVYTLTADGTVTRASYGSPTYFSIQPTRLVAGHGTQIILGDGNGAITYYDTETDFEWLWAPESGSTYWAACDDEGLRPYTYADRTFTPAGEAICVNSPMENHCYYMTLTANDRLLVAGGSLNYFGITYPGTAMYRDTDGRWTNFSPDSIAAATGLTYINLTSIVEDPADPTHHFASSARHGIYEYRNGKFVAHYDCTNTPLRYITGMSRDPRNYVSTDGLAYDADGNLWMLNNQVDTLLRVRLANGSWRAIYSADLANLPSCEKLLVDSRGWIWVTSRRATNQGHRAGVFALDYGSNITSTGDDRQRFRYTVSNQDGTSYTFNYVYAIAEDLDGSMWIGTDVGPFLIDDPESFLTDASYAVTQVKIPRNDGTDYADYLLSGTAITAIAVDGGGQKWFGSSSGVYVMSPDGITTVAHFTTDNSPLPSDVITSIAVRRTDGTVFIGTDKGLVAYESGIRSAADKLDDDAIYIYPNPVRPEYTGNITITGLTADCDVKITTAGGQVVAGGTSVGGTFTWDGRDPRGKRVATGVYYVLAATANGSDGAVGRIVVVK